MAEYLIGELDHISDPMKRFGYKFAVGAMAANPSSFRQRAHDLGVLNEDGMVDTDAVRSGFEHAFSGGYSVSVLGLTFSAPDGEELLRRMEM